MTKAFALGASLLALAVAVPANAAFVLTTNGGTGSVVTNPTGFTLFGSNGGSGNNIDTTYTDVSASAQTISFNFSYTYTTFDGDGSIYDPAGYIINGVKTQLSTQLGFGGSVSGTSSFLVNTGDTYGFYVNSTDDAFGPAQLAVTTGAVPEPATWAMMVMGFGLVGAAVRRRRLVAA